MVIYNFLTTARRSKKNGHGTDFLVEAAKSYTREFPEYLTQQLQKNSAVPIRPDICILFERYICINFAWRLKHEIREDAVT